MRIPLKGGDEQDALTRAKRFLHWRAGERKKIKRRYNKRERRTVRETLHDLLRYINARKN